MKKFGLLVLFITPLAVAQNAWINEFHYDNAGADANEFVEVVLQNYSSYTLSDFVITLYNGADGLPYGTNHNLSTFDAGSIDPSDNSFRYFSKAISGIQNDIDGLCLSYQGAVIQFLSYEGTFTATSGVANGITSTDIGVSQGN
ncbi:MAG TPA: hypothetical protein VF270_01130, partial [Ignavibacteriaceae bacterium]